MTKKALFFSLICVIFGSMLSSFGIYYFVYPFRFAPVGMDGVATMLSILFSGNTELTGYVSFAINVPLIILSFIFLDKKFTFLTLFCVACSSGFLVLFQKIDLINLIGGYPSDGDAIIPAIFSGILLGVRTGILLKVGASSGGVDIIAGIIQKKNPYVNFEKYVSLICYVIIAISYFVYDHNVEAILLSVIQMFVFEKAAAAVMHNVRNAVEFKIVTDNPELLRDDILGHLKHGATVLTGKGMFTGSERCMVFCVVNTRQVPEFMKILKRHDHVFVYCSDVNAVAGNFRRNKNDEVK